MEYKSLTYEELEKVLREWYFKQEQGRRVKIHFLDKESEAYFNRMVEQAAQRLMKGLGN